MLMVCTSACYADDGFRGSLEPIPANIAQKMIGHTWHSGCPLPLKSMSYLTLTYWGFDHKPHEGHLIVLNMLAGEALQIFNDLYKIKFPIEKMVLPEDQASSEDNNSSGFSCRYDEQSPGQLSPHSYGIAIDINPVYNPSMIANNKVDPESGKKYLDRELTHEGMIDEKVVTIFAKYGWKWGGYWAKEKVDYQHFQKDMDEHYVCSTLLPLPKKP